MKTGREPMKARIFTALTLVVLLAGCATEKGRITPKELTEFLSSEPPPAIIRQPVLPELLKGCRGHVLVPALGMKFVPRGANDPDEGQYLREERISAPYRIITPGARMTMEHSPSRLNVELDKYGRVVGLYCG